MRYRILPLVLFLAVSYGAAFFGSRFEPGAWYASLAKPSWTPPGWVFGPVWTVLYAAMGVAAWLVWRESGLSGARAALGAFFVQLVLNALWSWLFFGRQAPGAAFAEILLLWLAILVTAMLFRRHAPLAAALMVPYLLWVGFAAVLNFTIWRLNA